jgi:type II secretory pathway pseudopilin PulG
MTGAPIMTMTTKSLQPAADRAAFQSRRKRLAGFTLYELMVAMAVFMVIGGAAVRLFRAHVPLVTSSQNQAGLNMALRSVVAQMQIDAVNAGWGYTAVSRPWSLGITVVNSLAGGGAACNDPATFTYTANCFDTVNIISVDPKLVSIPSDATGKGCIDSSATEVYLTPVGLTTTATLLAAYNVGDQILLVDGGGTYLTTFTVTEPPQIESGMVKIKHNPTTTGGVGVGGVSASASDDPLGIARLMIGDSTQLPPNPTPAAGLPFTLGTQFCPVPAPDFAYKLASITYSVDATTDPTNPKLMRTQDGVSSVVAEQIIGFRVGASTWNSKIDSPYTYDPSVYFQDWTAIRALRVSVIGRTPPNSDVTNTFRNGFDNGTYRVESVSVVINPRNLSMNDL